MRKYARRQSSSCLFTHVFVNCMHPIRTHTECLSNPELRNKNLICVDWSKLADLINYFAAAQHAVTAGVYVGQLFGQLLVKDLGVDPKDIHLIGHSLGAHFVGQLGRQLAITGNRGKVARVTGECIRY